MTTNWLKWTSTVALLATFASGCSGGAMDEAGEDFLGPDGEVLSEEEGEIGTLEQGWWWSPPPPPPPTNTSTTTSSGSMNCSNPDGTNSTMAAIAVAAAKELGRWQATKDFVIAKTDGWSENSYGWQEAIKLASGTDSSGQPIGKSRCSDGECKNLQALLAMQYDSAANQVYLQGSGSTKVLLNPGALRSRTVAKWREQKSCDDAARDGDSTQCPRELHSLTFLSSEKGSCDTNFYFQAKQANGSSLRYVNQLKHKLRFADPHNPYVDFQDLGGGKVSIDPTYGLNEDGSSTAGSCVAACTKISYTNLSGDCCTCGGYNKAFKQSTFSSRVFICT